jgi:DNA-directed RNA polymerase subunit RPC12/RpoP
MNSKLIVASLTYRCPDCGEQVETPAARSDDCENYELLLCPNCRQVHCVNSASGEVVADDELGDPW